LWAFHTIQTSSYWFKGTIITPAGVFGATLGMTHWIFVNISDGAFSRFDAKPACDRRPDGQIDSEP